MADRYIRPTREQVEQYVRLDAEAFSDDPSVGLERIDRIADDVRVVERDGGVVAGLSLLRAGQWFGGRAVPMWGIGGLATAVAHRGSGVGRQLLAGMLDEARQADVPLVTLYASSPTFYRKSGFEPAGAIVQWQVAPGDVLPFDTGVAFARFAPTDAGPARAVYDRWAARRTATVARTAPYWQRKLEPVRSKHIYAYRFDFDGAAEGYIVLDGRRDDGALSALDLVAATPRAARAACTFIHRQRSVNGNFRWWAGPTDAVRWQIAEHTPRVHHYEEWLLRITDVEAALRRRGYPTIHAELHFEVTDASMPDNTGRYVLTLRAGEPTVQRGGSGAIAIDVRGLAALYTGHLTAEQLVDAGLADGPADQLAAATLTFSGSKPFMIDKF